MNTYFKYCTIAIISSFAFLIYSPAYSYLDSAFLWQKNNKKVLVLGDKHIACPADARDKQIITTLFEQCAEKPNKIPVLIEHILWPNHLVRDEDKKLFNHYEHKHYLYLIDYVSQYAFEHSYRYKSLTFCQSDIRRNQVFSALTEFYANFGYRIHALAEKPNAQHLFDTLPFTPEEKIKLYQSIKKDIDRDSTCQELFATLESMLDYCKYLKAHNNSTEFNTLIDTIAQKIQHCYNEFVQLTNTYPETTVFALFWRKIWDCQKLNDARAFWYDLSLDLTAIADLCFIKELLDTLKQHNSIITFTGAAHSEILNQTLQASGYTCTHLATGLPREQSNNAEQALWLVLQEFVK